MREYLSYNEAVECCKRNGIEVVDSYSYDTKKDVRTLRTFRPVGLKILRAIDCLVNRYRFTRLGNKHRG